MLKTLMKHEMRATAKTFIWLYIAFAAIAVVNMLVNPASMFNSTPGGGVGMAEASAIVPSTIRVIFGVLYGLALSAMVVGTLVVVILRFFRNLLGDEGYLMMTLPVSREQNIMSKLLVAVLWNVCTCVLIILSILLMFAAAGVLGDGIQAISDYARAGAPVGRWIFMFAVALVVSSFMGVLMLYAAMATGPNLLKNRVGGSILAYIAIYIISMIVTAVILFACARVFMDSGFFGGFNDFSRNAYEVEYFTRQAFAGVEFVVWASTIGSGAIAVGCWFLTRFMLKRKLNLA